MFAADELEAVRCQLMKEIAYMREEFEESFHHLIRQLEPNIEFEELTSAKWIIVDDSKSELREVKNKEGELSRALQMTILQNRDSDAFKSCNELFEKLDEFEDSIDRAGYWGTFQSVLHYALMKSTTFVRWKPRIDTSAALDHFFGYGIVLQADVHSFKMSAMIYGVKLASKVLELPSGIQIYRLNRKEINDRSPFVEPYLTSTSPFHLHSTASTEIRTSFDIDFSDTSDNTLFELQNMATKKASDQFQTVIDSLHLTQPGLFILGDIRMSSTLPISSGMRTTQRDRLPFKTIQIHKSDLPKLAQFVSLRSSKNDSDPILGQSINRFLLGKRRRKQVDQVIDFVIAFEVLLLTSNRSASQQELGYRFAINAATISNAAFRKSDKTATHLKFQTAYKVRSHILHGRPQENLSPVLQKGEFNNVGALAKYLDQRYRTIVAWLCSIDPGDRPYISLDGWNELLWS